MLQRVTLVFPLIRNSFAILGSSKCECSSVLNLKDVYHIIKLSESLKPYSGNLPHLSPTNYVFERMHMAQSVCPAIW